MAKTSGSNKTKKPSGKKTAKKGPQKIERLLNEIRRRNQTIMKEARKIDDLLSKAKFKPTELAAPLAEDCPPPVAVGNGGGD